MTTDHKKILEEAEASAKVVIDPELRKIAFQEIVRSALQKGDASKAAAQGNASPAVKKPVRAKTRSKITRALGTRDEVVKLDISPDEKGLPAWSALSQDWKKFCWILETARHKGVDGLTAPEIAYLIDRVFRENFSPAQVNNLKKKIKGGFVRAVKLDIGGRTVDSWKILSAGSAELKEPAEPAVTQ